VGRGAWIRQGLTGLLPEEPVYLLEGHGSEVWLADAKDVEYLPGRPETDRLDEIGGVGRVAAQGLIAEIGTDMGRFHTRVTWPPG
jgi:hypothetical protein